MIGDPRYTRPEIGAVWTQQRKMEGWLEVELAATEAWAEEGVVPARGRRGVPRASAAFTVEAVEERERVTDHDVAAFVDVVAASVGEDGRWIHYGLTSSDVLDTALALQLREAGEIVLAGAARLPRRADRAGARAPRHALRRPHPRRPRRADDLRPAPRRLRLRGRPQPRSGSRDAFEQLAVGKLSGAVGTYASMPPAVEARVMERLGPAARGRRRPRSSRATATPC